MSQEKVASWSQVHLTPSVFIKDLTFEAEKILRQAQKAAGLLNVSSTIFGDNSKIITVDKMYSCLSVVY